MNLDMPVLETSRLRIRPLEPTDFDALFRILDVEIDGMNPDNQRQRAARRRWLEWSILNYGELASMHQPPSGDRGIELHETGELIGACGFVAVLNEFSQLPYFGREAGIQPAHLNTVEFGLYYAISPAHRRQGYAVEAAQALIDYGFQMLRIRRLVATTTYDNLASQAVMRRLGMHLEKNPSSEPPWLQVVGILENRIGGR